jgi:hypothetical protein
VETGRKSLSYLVGAIHNLRRRTVVEELMSLETAGRSLPVPKSRRTLEVWRRGLDGVRLHVTKVGGSVFVSKSQLDDFFERLSAAKAKRQTDLGADLDCD